MACGMDFWKLRSGEYTAPFELEFMPLIRQRFRTVHATGYRSVQERARTSLQMMYFSYENTMKLQLIGFSYDKKSANAVMWKDKEYEYISSA